jgi:hypothetical protein
MNKRKSAKIRRMMQHLRDNPPSDAVADLVEHEKTYNEKHSEPIPAGKARYWQGQHISPTRRLKKIATRIINNNPSVPI